ncbi:hypothetical protein [Streptomyces sp. NPDC014006]
MAGTIAALVAYIVVDHLGASPLTAVGSSGSTFVVAAGFVFTVQDKLRRP